MAAGDPPSETSPLLRSEGNGTLPKSANPQLENGLTAAERGDVENNLSRTDSVDAGRAAQFQGNREAYKQLKYIFPAISVGVFLAAADQTIIVTSYGRIGSDLDALNLTSWVATSYFLTLTSFQPLYGKLSDIFGRKPCLLFAYTVFGLGGLFCGLAQNINQLIAARVFQGIGGGGMTTVATILLSDIVRLKDRGLWQGLINIVWATGSSTGAPLGGLLADYVGWRWSFLGQAPLCLIAFLGCLLTLKLPAQEDQHWRKKLGRVDFLGAVILVGAVFGLIFGMDRGSNVSWKIPMCYGPIIASIFLFALFIYVERHVASEPFAPGHIIFERSLLSSYLCNFFSFGSWLAGLYYLPLFYQAVDDYGATGAAVRLIPAIIAGVSGSLFGGIVMKRTGKYFWLTVFAYSLVTCGMAFILLCTGLVVNNTYGITAGTVMCAFGNGIGVTSSLIAIISNAAPEDQAVATACSYLFRSLGSVVGISLSATVIQQRLREALAAKLGSGREAKEIEQGVRRSLDYLKRLEPSVRVLVREAYGEAITRAYVLMLCIAFGAAVASWGIREKRLSK